MIDMVIDVSLGQNSYPIIFEHGALSRANEYLELKRKVLIVTDDGVPEAYAKTLAAQCSEAETVTVPQGEQSKNLDNYKMLLERMLELGFTRGDCVAAVGGGVVGDLAGFAAASYMRGVDFYNVPTTVLSQVDSSVGGKTAVDLGGIKNVVGAFYQPKAVLIDPDVLKTLPPRQISNGLAEAVKMSLTCDRTLFEIFEKGNVQAQMDLIIARSVQIKKRVVEQDEKEAGLRRILNFGHTLGHAIESEEALNGLYHGECVALGMLPMCSDQLRPRVKKVLKKLDLPTSYDFDPDSALNALKHDKKSAGKGIRVIFVDDPGRSRTLTLTPETIARQFGVILREGAV